MDALNNLEPAIIFPIATVLCLLLFFVYYIKILLPLAGTTEWITRIVEKPRFTFIMTRHRMTRRDILPIIIITVLFTALALIGLGGFETPQSFYTFSGEDRQITLELDTPEDIGGIMFYTGLWTGYYTLELSQDGVNWQEQYPQGDNEYAMHQKHSHVFKWRSADINEDNLPAKYIRITASKTPLQLGELAVFGKNGTVISKTRITHSNTPELFDEQQLVPEKPTYLNGAYFDEIYHARTALEHLVTIFPDQDAPEEMQAVYPYETTHPPLGKLFIAVGIMLFGMVPLGWRLIGALFGAAMLPVLYVFIKNLFGRTPIAICGTLLFGFEFMRFTQTRIATIDTYGVFFIILAYFFMYRFITTPPDSRFMKSVLPLAMSGLFFGLGCASKWIVIYAGLGLAALWLIRLITLGLYYRENGMDGFAGFAVKSVLFSTLFFVAVPAVIYCLSYIPYGLAKGMTPASGMFIDRSFYKIILDNQVSMLKYHGKLDAIHPYSSRWFQWIVNARPILYYRDYAGSLKSIIVSFGNPIVWWGGLLAIIAMVVRVTEYKDGKALFILIGYLSQLLPWLFISRVVFVYHYFPAVVFLTLALAHVFDTIYERAQGRYKTAVIGFTAASGALFALFYPALSGFYAPQWYFKYLLRWIPGAWPM